ncbi:PREDICTED: major histocompatibility complex class I-related gene protein-like [Cyprinodon variegatus]|uniref:major histocompatibility complex class I-related gene protein-like n=1 Tax=Cyprinodon variegatus TaxID=28743 RepID=UPI0007425385|nr:PREDICTED: major histocompatibility complex class I-related gene protein-like [Cyprinodon variegatus]
MERKLMLFFLIQTASAASFDIQFLVSYGIQSLPEYTDVLFVDDIIMFYYDSISEIGEPRQDWVRTIIKEDPQYWEPQMELSKQCHLSMKATAESFKLPANQTKVHVIQQILGCEVDDDTKEITAFNHYAYNGEDFISFDFNTKTWIAHHPRAKTIKEQWDILYESNKERRNFALIIFPLWLQIYLRYGNSTLHRKDLPSVSLLQRTPSSSINCHATGFYPEKAIIFWRKDGEEIHENVEHGEILPNLDGSFQMSIKLNASNIPLKEWGRYDCVFQLSGVQNDLITRLDKDVIRTNWKEGEENLSVTSIAIIATMAVLTVLIIPIIGFFAYKKKKAAEPLNTQ